MAVILQSPASPLHPALPSGRVTGGLIDGAGGIWAIVKAVLYCPYAQRVRVRGTQRQETETRDTGAAHLLCPPSPARCDGHRPRRRHWLPSASHEPGERATSGRSNARPHPIEEPTSPLPPPSRSPSVLLFRLSSTTSSRSPPALVLWPSPSVPIHPLSPLSPLSNLALPHALPLLSTVSRHHPPFRRILLVAPGPESSCRVEA